MRWSIETLGDLATIARGGSPRPIKEFLTEDSSGVNWIKISDATASDKYIINTKQKIRKEGVARSRIVYPGDFLLSNSMSFGRPYIMKTTGAIHDGWLVFQNIVDRISPDFLYHLLSSKLVVHQFEEKASGSTVRNLNIQRVKSVGVPVPPMEEQERIVEILDQAFEAIDKAKANIERNLANARELFQSRLNEIFSNPPADWEVKPLGEVCDLENGDRGKNYPKPTDLADNGVPWVNAGDLSEGFCEVTTANHITTGAYERLSRGKFKGGDVLFCLRGSLGKHGQVRSGDFGAIASSLIIIKTSSHLDSCFLNHWLNCGYCKTQIDKYAGGAAQPNLGGKDLGRFHFPVPSQAEKATIVDHLGKLEQQVKGLKMNYQSQLNNLEELRQSILEQAFEGKLTEPIAQ